MMGIKIVIAFATGIISLTGLVGASHFDPPSQEVRELAPGTPIEREITGSETHSYRISLPAHQFVRISVTQREVDLVIRVLSPEGRLLTQVERQAGLKASFVTESMGEYGLELRATKKDAPRGRYELIIDESRAATIQDENRVAAERVLVEGNQLRAQRKAEALRSALTKYEVALSLYQAADDRDGQVDVLNTIAQLYISLGEVQRAQECFSRALPLAQSLTDRFWEAIIHSGLGRIHQLLGDPYDALVDYNRALEIERARGDKLKEASAFGSIGTVYFSMGEFPRALDYYMESLAMKRAEGRRATVSSISYRITETVALHNIGETYAMLGEYTEALEYLTQVLAICREVNYPRGVVSALNIIGSIHASSGDPGKALEYLEEARTLGRKIEAQIEQAGTLLPMGAVYSDLGEQQRALEVLGQGLSICRLLGIRAEEATALNALGLVYTRLGEREKALDYYTQALLLSRTIGSRSDEAEALYGLARAHRDSGNLIEANAKIDAALSIIESVRSAVAGQQLRTSWMASKRSYYEAQVDILMRRHEKQPSAGYDAMALAASERSRARSLLESLIEARAEIREGVDRALLEQGRVLQQELNAKAARMTQLLSGRHSQEEADSVRKEVDALVMRYQEVQAQVRATSPRYAALTQPTPLSLKEIQQQVLDSETLMLEYALGEERSYLWAITDRSIASFELPKRGEVEAAARRVYELMLVSHRRQHKRESELAAAELSRMLLWPVADRLERKRLLIVAHGALEYVPFGSLPEPASRRAEEQESRSNPLSFTPLIANHEIVNLPSASVLDVLRRERSGRRGAENLVAAISDPVFQRDDPRVKSETKIREPVRSNPMPGLVRSAGDTGSGSFERLYFTRREAEAIIELAGARQSLKALDFDASRDTVERGRLDQYRIVHFATHGLLNSRHPELSGVVLSLVDKQGRPQDGFLRVHDIYNLKLNADLVVLSACRTALGKEIKSEGLVGLTRGFMYAGASRVVASLWDVRDEATAELMKRFYRGILKEGMRPTAALRAAQVSMSKEPNWQAPYYWAGFVLQGEWK